MLMQHCVRWCSACFARWWRWEQRSLDRQRKQLIQELGAQAGSKLHPMGLTPDARGLYTVLCPSCRCVRPPLLQHAHVRLCCRDPSLMALHCLRALLICLSALTLPTPYHSPGDGTAQAVRLSRSCRSPAAPADLAHALLRLCPKRGSPEAHALETAKQEEAAQAGESRAKVALAAADMEQLRRMQARHARLFEEQRQRVRGIVGDPEEGHQIRCICVAECTDTHSSTALCVVEHAGTMSQFRVYVTALCGAQLC